jgi:signal transduction histidine kinase
LLTGLTLADVISFEYRNAAAHLVLDTVDACVAGLVSYLLYGRLLHSRRLQDLLLLQALLLLALANLVTSVVLLAAIDDRGERLEVWVALSLRVVAAVLLTVAAAAGRDRLVSQISGLRLLRAPCALVLMCLAGLGAVSSRLPRALDASEAPTLLSGHTVLVAAQIFMMTCFFLAAYLFTRQARGSADHLVRLLGPACVLAGCARINYALFPSLYSQWLSTGDVLRTAFYLVLLVGAAREIRAFWAAQAQAAVTEDRRRLARELHDGVVQELGYIRAESGAMRTLDLPRTERILGACDRALDEARQAVEAMGTCGEREEPLGFTVHRAARQVADRFGVALEVELDDTVTADRRQRHALLRIVREAVGNAARHGDATRLKIELQRIPDGQRRLVVCDDGMGFDVPAATTERKGFGLTSMRERSEGLPGAFHVESMPGAGATVSVTW